MNPGKIQGKLTAMAAKYRVKHPDKSRKVPFRPKAARNAFQGMNQYAPRFDCGHGIHTEKQKEFARHVMGQLP